MAYCKKVLDRFSTFIHRGKRLWYDYQSPYKKKNLNLLQIIQRRDLRLNLTNLKPNVGKLSEHQTRPSH